MVNEAEPFADAVQAVQRTAQACGVPMLLVGAHARDLLLQEWGVEASMRKTRDIDFGIRVGSWDEYRTLRKALAATGEFEIVGRNPHKVLYQGRIEVDLVPFGEIATRDGRLPCWPDDFRQEMVVLGYQEALDRARMCPIAKVPRITLPAFVGLKILAWNDGPHRRAKDAVDLAFVLKNLYAMKAVVEAVFEMQDEAWDDFDRRCQRWLGGQVRSAFESVPRSALRIVLSRESNARGEWLLARQMSPVYPKAEDARKALEGLLEGLSDPGEKKP